jgi:hypothetical protein
MTFLRAAILRLPGRGPRRRGGKRLPARWRQRARALWRRVRLAPRGVRLALVGASIAVLLVATHFAYHVARKPSELLFPLSGALDKGPAETWRHYGALFREYSTATLAPELLAALAQVEGAGNPLARTYWRWRFSWNPLAIYQPASSAVGMYQMTDAAFADAQDYCIRDHVVVRAGCPSGYLYGRIVPSRAVELAAIFLDRNAAALLRRARRPVPARQKEMLVAAIHLCGPGGAEALLRRNFRFGAGERCGDHDVARYLAKVDAVKREFLRLAAER